MVKMNILIAEDGLFLKSQLEDVLQPYAIRVDHAHEGFAAVCAMREHQHYVVIVTHQLKNVGGVFVGTQLKKANPQTEVILIAGGALTDLERKRCLEKKFLVFENLDDRCKISEAVRRIHRRLFGEL